MVPHYLLHVPGRERNELRSYDERYVPGSPHTQLSHLELWLLGQDDNMLDHFFFYWPPNLIMKLRVLSSSTFFAVEAYTCRKWNIHTHLRRWFRDVPQFLRKLSACDGVISGSEVLSFFDRLRFHGNDLDIYVPLHGVLPMGRYLKYNGFSFQASLRGHPLFDAAVMLLPMASRHPNSARPFAKIPTRGHVRKQRHQSRDEAGYVFSTFNFVRSIPRPPFLGHRVQLIAVSCDPIEYIVNNFHSTGVMNVLTGTHGICLFPHMTFSHRTMVVCRDLAQHSGWNAPWMDKYRNRGFKICTAADRPPDCAELHTWRRKVGDKLTWVLPYDRITLQPLKAALDPYFHYPFEVLGTSHEVTPIGAALRVGPRFMYSSIAFLAKHRNSSVAAHYQSIELTAAFPEHDNAVFDDNFTDSATESDVQEEGTETESASENDEGEESE